MTELTIDQALQQGIEAHKAGQVQEADRLYTAILKAQPKHPDANHNMGVLAVGIGKIEQALPFFKTALEANPATAQYWLSYIDALIKLEQLAVAKAVFDQVKSKGAEGDGFDKLEQRLQKLVENPLGNNQTTLEVTPVQPNILNSIKPDQAIKLAKKKAKDGAPEEAKLIYQDILAKFPNNKRARDGLKGLASPPVSKASKAHNPPQDQLQTLINLYSQGQLQQAFKQAETLVQQFPQSAILFNIQGAVLKGLGQLDTSVKAFKKALVIKPDYAEAYNNMGNALKEQGKLEETIEAYNKALAIKPDYADAYYNMGNTLKEQGKMEEAIEAYNKAISLKPDYADAYSNMGNVLKGQGKLKEAIEAYNKALAIKPDNAEAYNNMGNALKDQGKLEEAIEDYKKALAIKPDYADAFYNMGNALQRVVFRKPSPSFQNIITSILDYKTFVKPSDISSAAISLLKFEPVLRKVLQQHSNGQLIQFLNEAVLNLSKLPLLLKLMTVCPIADLELEDVLRDIRSSLLSSVSQLEGSPEVLRFQSALALQCFTNEYIYEQTDGETKALKTLKASVKKTLSNGKQPSPQFILCLASYKALHGYEWCDFLAVNRDIEEVVQRQVIEPRQEARIKPNISVLEEITDTVSSKVREQYEESPYPRWVNLGLRLVPAPIEQIIEEIDLRLSHPKINGVDAPNILIAGCGTGQHSIGTASRFKNSKVLAIDLSLSSLAYAKRKTEELGIQNIEYMQADILDLSKLKRQFDIVESVGVLHHMDEPMAGWRVLTDCLKPGGLMMIGLYSEFARQGIVEMREEIGQVVNGSSDFAMKTFRNSVINSDKDHHNKILTSPDFYSLSTLRDLLFHVQEHRFTISQIKDCLRELGLEFCGFEADKIVQNFKLNNTRADDPYDLDKWNSYEESNANTFGAMYQFWCQKLA